MEKEKLKSIIGYEGLYLVSNKGSIYRSSNMRKRKLHIGNSGYLMVNLSKNASVKIHSVHRLVANSFIGNIENKVVNHINGNKKDNNLENIEVVTQRCNVHHFYGSLTGITKEKNRSKYRVRLFHNGKNKHIGTYHNIQEAIQVRNNYLKENELD